MSDQSGKVGSEYCSQPVLLQYSGSVTARLRISARMINVSLNRYHHTITNVVAQTLAVTGKIR